MVTIIIPTYNERENIRPLLKSIFSRMPSVRVLVVDDNSPDGTAACVSEAQKTYRNLELLKRTGKFGLGSAYRDAFRKVLADPDCETVVMMDGDGSHEAEYLPELLGRGTKTTVVIGSRYVRGGRTENWELWRRMLSRGANVYARVVAGLPVRDCTAGFMGIRTSYLRRINLDAFHVSGYAFLIELKHALLCAGATFQEIPITFRNRRLGSSKMSNHIIREGIIAPWLLRFGRT